MPGSPPLPTHHNPTQTDSTSHDPHKGAVDESDVTLRVGPTQTQTRTGWQTFKRFLKAAGLAIAGVALFHAMMAAWVFLAGYAPEETFPVQSFHPFALHQGVAAHSPGYRAPDQVFPLDLTRQNYISVIGGETRVIITQLPSHAVGSRGAIILESIQVHGQSTTLVSLSDGQNHLDIEGSRDASHTVRVVVPANVPTLPYLSLTASDLTVEIDDSAKDISFAHLTIATDHLVSLPDALPEFGFLDIDIQEGDICGTFNISHRLSLHTGTGMIEAQLHIVAPDRYEHKPAINPPQVEATTGMGSIDLTVLFQAEDIESSVVGITQMGVVRIQQTPGFVGGFVADVGTGEMKVSTKSPKVLRIVDNSPGHAEGVVRYDDKVELTGNVIGGETKLPSPVHCPPHCPPDGLAHDASSDRSIQTASPYPESSFTIATTASQSSTLTVQTHSPYPDHSFTAIADDAEPRFTIQTDPPYPAPALTGAANDDEPRYTVQTDPPGSQDVYTMHVRVGTPGVNIPTGVPYPEPSYMVITVPRPSARSSSSVFTASPSFSSESKSKKHCRATHTTEPRFTIQTDPSYPQSTFSINDQGLRRYPVQADVPVPTEIAINQMEGSGSEDRDPRVAVHGDPAHDDVSEDVVEEEVKDDDHTHEDSSLPDHCEPPLCLVTTSDPDPPTVGAGADPNIANLGNSLPRGGLVRGEAKMGSVELRL